MTLTPGALSEEKTSLLTNIQSVADLRNLYPQRIFSTFETNISDDEENRLKNDPAAWLAEQGFLSPEINVILVGGFSALAENGSNEPIRTLATEMLNSIKNALREQHKKIACDLFLPLTRQLIHRSLAVAIHNTATDYLQDILETTDSTPEIREQRLQDLNTIFHAFSLVNLTSRLQSQKLFCPKAGTYHLMNVTNPFANTPSNRLKQKKKHRNLQAAHQHFAVRLQHLHILEHQGMGFQKTAFIEK